MALFFDRKWFDARLEAVGRTHNELAEAMGLPLVDLAAIWKDQRELTHQEVSVMADVLQATPAEVADHAGVSTPVPPEDTSDAADNGDIDARLDDIVARLERLERAVADVKALALDIRSRPEHGGGLSE